MWSKEKLSGRTYKIGVCGDEFLVRKIKVGELIDDKEQDAKKKSCNLISKALIEPAMTPEEVNGLDYDIYTELQSQLMDLNGLSAKGREAIQGNLETIPQDSSSSRSPDGSESSPAK
jgi:hypothetical protein